MRRLLAILVAALVPAVPADARIGPGVLMGGCTANFVFRDATDLYLGFAAHCVEDLQGAANDPTEPAQPHECAPPTHPLGTAIQIEGASAAGRLAYSSWHTMRVLGEKSESACRINDFALVRIDPRDHAAVDPSVPHWGGPVGLRRAPVADRETFVSFGRSDLRRDVEALMPRQGYVQYTHWDGFYHSTQFLTPGIHGDSGSAVLDGSGGAVGVLIDLDTNGPGVNGVADLARALDYMRSHGGPDARLVTGTAPFAGADLPTVVESPPSSPEPPPPAPAPAPAPPASSPSEAPAPAVSDPAPKPKQAKRKPARRCRGKRQARNKRCRAAAQRRRARHRR